MKKLKTYYFLISLIFLVNNSYFAQNKTKSQKKSSIAYAEKIYLQLNSTVFTSDQTIWFKAIVTNVNQKPTTLSKVLHVDLIDFDEKIVNSKMLKIDNGSTDNFFDLQEIRPLPEGKYMIRAYTKWNTNFKEPFISKQYIDIYKPSRIAKNKTPIREVIISEKENKELELSAKIFPKTINPKFKGKLKVLLDIDGKKDVLTLKKDDNKEYSLTYLLPKNTVKAKIEVQLDSVRIKNFDFKSFNSFSKTIAVDKNFIDLQFFPEGGKLIDGLTSIVGFKALDYKNEGIPISGVIKDENDRIITHFKSNQLGMGFCQLKPDKNKVYSAEVLLNSTKHKFKLPEIYNKGYVLTAKTTQEFFKLQLRSNFSKTDSLFIKAQARGTTYSITKVQCVNGNVKLAFKKNIFPEGIVTFTAFNQQNHPICERLVFNYKENTNRLKTVVKKNKKSFSQRDKIVFDINTREIDNSTDYKVNSSFLVINKRQLNNIQVQKSNILSYFLLESELKGNIEQPSFYFNPNNNQRFYAIDALLLTQGWRNYVFKPTEEEIFFKHQPEKNLKIVGTIEEFAKRKRKNPIHLTLMTLDKENFQTELTTMDSLGRFSFNLKDIFTKDLRYLIQTQNHNKRNKALTVNIHKPKPLKINFEKEEEFQLVDKFNIYVNENRKRFAKENPFSVDENGFILDEITVKTRLLSPIQKKMTDEHGEPDVIIEGKVLKPKYEKWMSGLFSLLQAKYFNDIDVYDTGSSFVAKVPETSFTFIIIDGIPVDKYDYNLVGFLSVDEVKSIEIIKFPKNPAKYYEDVFDKPLSRAPNFSFLNIYSHAGKGLYGMLSSKGIFKSTLPNFAVKKEFYAPKHENLTKSDWDFPDLRSTVFWEPNVTLDKNGTGRLEFYTDDNIGEMLVIIESIAEDGKIGYYETSYNVKKNLKKSDL